MSTAPLGSSYTQFKNDSPRAPSSVTRLSSSNVTAAAPAKRVTFFKSGDAQFGGVRMAIHKRSFKCFDALLDDLSQKVPLPFGVRTVTTPRGTHGVNRLDQLEDGGCYLCSDRRQVKPINVEAAGKRGAAWHHSHPHNIRRKPSRPEEAPAAHPGQRYHRHPKRIVLVKNNDPAVRRSITLSRRTARSLRVFVDEISELMQCHIRKLYTLDGRKIDSIQSLMHCPSVLVCVGREPFRPLLVESFRKSSDEKLPGLGTRSHSPVCSEGHESKKNVNFGLETKKSIIHPRSDSSNRSTRFSLSSDKSFPNGLNMTPGNTDCVGNCPHVKQSIMNDDIEKRVFVNNDGSLSVEMKVRFRLLNDETLEWSTEIKKSTGTVNDVSLVKDEPHYLQQGKFDSCSDPESHCEVEEAYIKKHQQRQMEVSHCQNCCNHCQEYDIWKNPMHGDPGAFRQIRSSSSSTSSNKIVCKKASRENIRTMSRSSEEYTEHVVKKAACFQQDGDTKVEYCTISRCCSRSEVCAMSTTSRSRTPNEEQCETSDNAQVSDIDEARSNSAASAGSTHSQNEHISVNVTQVSEDCPCSVISNSSKVLEELKEDQDDDDDDDDDDLPPSVSRASILSQSEIHEDCEGVRCIASKTSNNLHKSVSPIYNSSPRPPSQCRNSSKTVSPGIEVPEEQDEDLIEDTERANSAISTISKVSSKLSKSHKFQCGGATPVSVVSIEDAEKRAISNISTSSIRSGRSRMSNICPHCGGLNRETTPASRPSKNPDGQKVEEKSEIVNGQDVETPEGRTASAISSQTNASERSRKSNKSNRTVSEKVLTASSNISETLTHENVKEEYKETEHRTLSGMSARTNASSKSRKSNKSQSNVSEHAITPLSIISDGHLDQEYDKKPEEEERAASTLSNSTRASATSKASTKHQSKVSARPNSPRSIQSEHVNCEDEQANLETEKRSQSALSSKSNVSARSAKSNKSNCNVTERVLTPSSNISETLTHENVKEEYKETEHRALSGMSARTNASSKSRKSNKSQSNVSEHAITPLSIISDGHLDQEYDKKPEEEERAASTLSNSTRVSATSKTSTKHQSKVSARPNSPRSIKSENVNCEDEQATLETEKRSQSALSSKTNVSARSAKSNKSNCNVTERVLTPSSNLSKSQADEKVKGEDEETESRVLSSMSARTNTSSKSRSNKAECNVSRVVTPASIASDCDQETHTPFNNEDKPVTEERALSAMSSTSVSARSRKSNKSNCCLFEQAVSSRSKISGTADGNIDGEADEEGIEERATSAMSHISEASANSKKSNQQDCCSSEIATHVNQENIQTAEEGEERAMSVGTNKSMNSNSSKKHRVSTPNPKSSNIRDSFAGDKALQGEGRVGSALSVNSEASCMSRKSKKCGASERSVSSISEAKLYSEINVAAKEIVEMVISTVSVTGATKDSEEQCNASERSFTPASTISVSLGLVEDHSIVEPDERAASAMSLRSQSSAKSAKSKSNCSRRSERATPKSEVPDEKEAGQGTAEAEDRPKSTMSQRNKVSERPKKSEYNGSPSPNRILTPASDLSDTNPKAEMAIVKSTSTKNSAKSKPYDHLNVKDERALSTMSKSSSSSTHRKSPSRDFRPSSKASSVSKHSETHITNEDPEKQGVIESVNETKSMEVKVKSDGKKPSSNCSKSPSQHRKSKAAYDAISTATSRPVSSASACSASGKLCVKDNTDNNVDERPNSNLSNVSSALKIQEDENDHDIENGINRSIKSSKKASKKNLDIEGNSNLTDISIISHNCVSPIASKGKPVKNKRSTIPPTTSNDSELSHSLSAADLLREMSDNTRPDSRETRTRRMSEKTCNDDFEAKDSHRIVSDNKSDKSSRNRYKKSGSSFQRNREEDISELVPSNLPNATPAEVVNEWLKKIPSDSSMYEMGDDFHENIDEIETQKSEKVEESSPEELKELSEEVAKPEEEKKEDNEEEEGASPLEEEDHKRCAEEQTDSTFLNNDEKPQSAAIKCPNREALPKSCQSSVQVMKVLLSPKLDRCNSLPEVSPVYGRKLSTSAKGLLDCLAKIQLIDLDTTDVKARDARYNELMNILQSLWLCDPSDSERCNEFKDLDDEFNPRSSSGVDVSSGSAGSGKSSVNGGMDQTPKMELSQSRASPIIETLQQLQEETEVIEGKDSFSDSSPKLVLDAEEPTVMTDPATPDIASRIQLSPESEGRGTDENKQKREVGQDSDETIGSTGSPKEISGKPSLSNKSSGNDINMLRSPDETEADLQEFTSSGTSPSVEGIKLANDFSQDPNPTWVLNLLKKLEKQFMTHYMNAMTEFKVRWDLDDNEMLNSMINELRDEVGRRIQLSINRELQKLQSRAGKEPKPPLKGVSRESTVQTEQRRRRLKGMRIKSVNESIKSDEDYTGTGTDFSEQRSEDEFCPCDTCMKKKMESRLVELNQCVVSSAPVLKDFDLRKILQMKAEPPRVEQSVKKLTDNLDKPEEDGNRGQDVEKLHSEAEGEGHEDEQNEKDHEGATKEDAEAEQTDETAKQDIDEEIAGEDNTADEIEENIGTNKVDGIERSENQESLEGKEIETAEDDASVADDADKHSQELDVVEKSETDEDNKADIRGEIADKSETGEETETFEEGGAEVSFAKETEAVVECEAGKDGASEEDDSPKELAENHMEDEAVEGNIDAEGNEENETGEGGENSIEEEPEEDLTAGPDTTESGNASGGEAAKEDDAADQDKMSGNSIASEEGEAIQEVETFQVEENETEFTKASETPEAVVEVGNPDVGETAEEGGSVEEENETDKGDNAEADETAEDDDLAEEDHENIDEGDEAEIQGQEDENELNITESEAKSQDAANNSRDDNGFENEQEAVVETPDKDDERQDQGASAKGEDEIEKNEEEETLASSAEIEGQVYVTSRENTEDAEAGIEHLETELDIKRCTCYVNGDSIEEIGNAQMVKSESIAASTEESSGRDVAETTQEKVCECERNPQNKEDEEEAEAVDTEVQDFTPMNPKDENNKMDMENVEEDSTGVYEKQLIKQITKSSIQSQQGSIQSYRSSASSEEDKGIDPRIKVCKYNPESASEVVERQVYSKKKSAVRPVKSGKPKGNDIN